MRENQSKIDAGTRCARAAWLLAAALCVPAEAHPGHGQADWPGWSALHYLLEPGHAGVLGLAVAGLLALAGVRALLRRRARART